MFFKIFSSDVDAEKYQRGFQTIKKDDPNEQLFYDGNHVFDDGVWGDKICFISFVSFLDHFDLNSCFMYISNICDLWDITTFQKLLTYDVSFTHCTNLLYRSLDLQKYDISLFLLQNGVDISSQERNLFHEAIKLNDADILRALLSLDVCICPEDINIGFLTAVRYNNTEMVKLLLEHGADIHIYSDDALRSAVRKSYFEMVVLLLSYGANLHIRDNFALRWAANNGDHKMAALLLEYGADITCISPFAVSWARQNNDQELLTVFHQYGLDN